MPAVTLGKKVETVFRKHPEPSTSAPLLAAWAGALRGTKSKEKSKRYAKESN